ncbi:MAG: DUF3857 and transglutaminase domain-containing protein [candidate division WOR-3 bacterium]
MRTVIYYKLIVFSIIFMIQCTSYSQKRLNLKSYFNKPTLTFSKIDFETTPKKEDYPESDAIFLLREAKYEANKIFTFTEHIIIKIFNDAGKKYANVRIPYWSDIGDVVYLEARTIKPNGEVITLNKDDVFEVSDFPDFILYADSKAKVFTFPNVDTNCILEYIYTIALKYPYVPIWFFQTDEFTIFAKFSYEVPAYLGFKYIYSNLPGKEIKKEISDYPGWNRGSFSVRELPALKKEVFSPPLTEMSSWILMTWSSLQFLFNEITSREESWALIGQDYKNFVSKTIMPDKEIVQKANELTSGCNTDEDKIKNIVNFIQKNFRYVAVAIEGHRTLPNAPSKVLKNLYGDCKDLSGLLISLLKAVNIEAYPVLLRTKNSGNLIENFPSRNQINHVVVAIPLKYFNDRKIYLKAIVTGENEYSSDDDYVIVDPTASSMPLGTIPSAIQGSNALLCIDENSHLAKLPESEYRDNTILNKVFLDSDNNGIFSMQIAGEEAARLRWQINRSSRDELREYFKKFIDEIPIKIVLDTFEIENLYMFDSALKIIIKFKKSGGTGVYKEQILIPVIFSPLKYFTELYNTKKREHHIYLDFPYYQSDIFKTVVSKEYNLMGLPEKTNINNEWFDYSMSSYYSGDTVVVNRAVAVKSRIIPKDEFEKIKGDIDKVMDSYHKVIILSKKK